MAPVKCRHPKCTQTFARRGNMEIHYTGSHTALKFPCPKCKKTFAYSSNLVRHMRNSHTTNKSKIYSTSGSIDDKKVKKKNKVYFKMPVRRQTRGQQNSGLSRNVSTNSSSTDSNSEELIRNPPEQPPRNLLNSSSSLLTRDEPLENLKSLGDVEPKDSQKLQIQVRRNRVFLTRTRATRLRLGRRLVFLKPDFKTKHRQMALLKRGKKGILKIMKPTKCLNQAFLKKLLIEKCKPKQMANKMIQTQPRVDTELEKVTADLWDCNDNMDISNHFHQSDQSVQTNKTKGQLLQPNKSASLVTGAMYSSRLRELDNNNRINRVSSKEKAGDVISLEPPREALIQANAPVNKEVTNNSPNETAPLILEVDSVSFQYFEHTLSIKCDLDYTRIKNISLVDIDCPICTTEFLHFHNAIYHQTNKQCDRLCPICCPRFTNFHHKICGNFVYRENE